MEKIHTLGAKEKSVNKLTVFCYFITNSIRVRNSSTDGTEPHDMCYENCLINRRHDMTLRL